MRGILCLATATMQKLEQCTLSVSKSINYFLVSVRFFFACTDKWTAVCHAITEFPLAIYNESNHLTKRWKFLSSFFLFHSKQWHKAKQIRALELIIWEVNELKCDEVAYETRLLTLLRRKCVFVAAFFLEFVCWCLVLCSFIFCVTFRKNVIQCEVLRITQPNVKENEKRIQRNP